MRDCWNGYREGQKLRRERAPQTVAKLETKGCQAKDKPTRMTTGHTKRTAASSRYIRPRPGPTHQTSRMPAWPVDTHHG